MDFTFSVSPRQAAFLRAEEDEVLYGGAAGGGKSYGQVVDAFRYAMEYPKSRQLLLRSSFPALERSLILTALEIIPRALYTYSSTKHKMRFVNGSLLEFGFLASDADVTMYQSAEYDVIRFDELTHFTEYQYLYMVSRLRGTSGYPKQMKSTTNPGNRGHGWVKARFISAAPPNTPLHTPEGRTRIFIPARVEDNCFLMQKDADYLARLELLPENEKKALLHGEWDVFEGQFFSEFFREKHVITPEDIPEGYKRFRSLDYGLDMTACYWWAVGPDETLLCYRELYESGLTLSEAARKILKRTPPEERIAYTVASPDLWNRRQDTGKSGVEIMAEVGLVDLIKADNRRIPGWRVLREYLRREKIRIFSSCVNLVRTLPALLYDPLTPEDAASSPHEITHAPESARYAVMSRPLPARELKPQRQGRFTPGEIADLKEKSENEIQKRR